MKKIFSVLVVVLLLSAFALPTNAYSWHSSTHGHENDNAVADVRNIVYEYLCENTELNKAAICGILGNIWAECCFNVEEVYGSYHGLCQWGGDRWTACCNYCHKHGYDEYSVLGQCSYLVYELKNNYADTYKKLLKVANSEDGVYSAESIFRINFEGCGTQGMERRKDAAVNYWQCLPEQVVPTTVTETTIEVVTTEPTTKAPVTAQPETATEATTETTTETEVIEETEVKVGTPEKEEEDEEEEKNNLLERVKSLFERKWQEIKDFFNK